MATVQRRPCHYKPTEELDGTLLCSHGSCLRVRPKRSPSSSTMRAQSLLLGTSRLLSGWESTRSSRFHARTGLELLPLITILPLHFHPPSQMSTDTTMAPPLGLNVPHIPIRTRTATPTLVTPIPTHVTILAMSSRTARWRTANQPERPSSSNHLHQHQRTNTEERRQAQDRPSGLLRGIVTTTIIHPCHQRYRGTTAQNKRPANVAQRMSGRERLW